MDKKYRTSLYTIFVKLDDEENRHLLVHGYTGAIDIVSNKAAKFLKLGGVILKQDAISGKLPISKQTFDNLTKRGQITSLSPLEEREHVKKLANMLHRKESKIRNWLFLVAYDCNFRCPYCFENGISENGKSWSGGVFTKELVDKAYQAMYELEPNRSMHANKITLYGGEPLLAKNQEVVRYMIKKGIENGFNFGAITNGYELEHYTDIMSPKGLSSLQITIDGQKDKHDTRRTHCSDGGSFDKIMINIQLALDLGVEISVRVNTDFNNMSDIPALEDEFRKRGFYNYKRFRMYSALIHADDDMDCNVIMTSEAVDQNKQKKKSGNLPFEVREEDVFNADAQYINFEKEEARFNDGVSAIELEKENNRIQFFYSNEESNEKIRTLNRGKYINKFYEVMDNDEHTTACQDFSISRRIRDVLEGRGLMDFRATFCSAQTGMMIFDPYGDLYTCWELVGIDQHKVGKYTDGIEFYLEELNNWYGRNIGKTPACSQCKYAFFCGGGCMAGALREGKGYNSPYCDGLPKTFHSVVPKTFKEFMAEKDGLNLIVNEG